jgi:hypothetical protein
MRGDTLQFHRLSFVPEGPDVVVGRPETGSYVVLPADGAALLRRLVDGMPADRAADWYRTTFAEPVDLDDFLRTLREVGFVRPVGAPPEPESEPVGPSDRARRLGRAAFSGPARAGYLLLIAACAALLVRHPALRPDPAMIWFTDSLVAVQVFVLLAQTPLGFLHEGYHVLALRRLGLAGGLGISNRLTYVVFETVSNGLLSVPRRRRYLPLLAGILLDLVVFSVLDVTAWFTRDADGSFSLLGRMCLCVSFTVLTRVAWQFQLHLQTDLYHVLATALNCQDLHAASTAVLGNRIRRATGRTNRLVDEEQWTERDLRVGAWYGWFVAAGYLVTLGLGVLVTVPVVVGYARRGAAGLAAGPLTAPFWDSLVSLSLIVVNMVLPALLARRKRRRDADRRPRRVAADRGVNR